MSWKTSPFAVAWLSLAAAALGQEPKAPPDATPDAARKESRQAPGPPTLVNVALEVKLSDRIGDGTPAEKTLQFTIGDHGRSSVRSRASLQREQGVLTVPINVDASVQVVGPDRVRLDLGLEYDTDTPAVQESVRHREFRLNLTGLLLRSGEPLVAIEAPDPLLDRTIRVEVKATLLR